MSRRAGIRKAWCAQGWERMANELLWPDYRMGWSRTRKRAGVLECSMGFRRSEVARTRDCSNWSRGNSRLRTGRVGLTSLDMVRVVIPGTAPFR